MEETTTRLDKEEKGRECQPHHIGTINDTWNNRPHKPNPKIWAQKIKHQKKKKKKKKRKGQRKMKTDEGSSIYMIYT
jgi:hypothetical protein